MPHKTLRGIPTQSPVLPTVSDVRPRKSVNSSSLIFPGEHRWIAIANMVQFHNAVGSADLTNVLVGDTAQQVGECGLLHSGSRFPNFIQRLDGARVDFWLSTMTRLLGPRHSPPRFQAERVCLPNTQYRSRLLRTRVYFRLRYYVWVSVVNAMTRYV